MVKKVTEKKSAMIMIKKSTHKRLSGFGHGVNQTFDDAITSLMDFYDEHMCEHLTMKTDCPICQEHFKNHINHKEPKKK